MPSRPQNLGPENVRPDGDDGAKATRASVVETAAALRATGPSANALRAQDLTPPGPPSGSPGDGARVASAAQAHPLLPPRYRNGAAVSSAPMGTAPLRYDAAGRVAWNEIWDDFCDLALAGGPPHRPTPLAAPTPAEARARAADQTRVLDELERALLIVTGWPVRRFAAPGWIGVVCPDAAAADWLRHAIVTENVAARRQGGTLLLPAGPDFRLEEEIKNVVTAVAKTHHYWSEHAAEAWPPNHHSGGSRSK